jgi:hypothetical protein
MFAGRRCPARKSDPRSGCRKSVIISQRKAPPCDGPAGLSLLGVRRQGAPAGTSCKTPIGRRIFLAILSKEKPRRSGAEFAMRVCRVYVARFRAVPGPHDRLLSAPRARARVDWRNANGKPVLGLLLQKEEKR